MVTKGRVLVVDDEPDIIGLIRILLEKEGYEVIDACRGEEGLIKANREDPDIVLIDIRLPDMDGNKLLKRIKENNPTQSVIMVTAYADVDNAITSLKFGADDFIKKPFDNAHLIHIVNRSFEGREVVREKEDLKRRYEKLVKGGVMSEKEKLVLYRLTQHPGLSDKEVSEKVGIPRTTLTGIKNKLKKRGMYKVRNIPNFPVLGFELMSAITFELNPSTSYYRDLEKDSEILGKRGVIYSQITDLEGYILCMFRDYTEYKRDIEPYLNELIYGNYFKRVRIHHFPLELSRVIRFMDFSPLIHRLFEIGGELEFDECFIGNVDQMRVSKTEGVLINALTRYPELSDAEIAERVSLSRARISQIKKKLVEAGVIKTLVFPELHSSGGSLISVISAGLNPKCSDEGGRDLADAIKFEPSTLFSVLSDTEFLSINVLKDYDHYKEVYDNINKVGKESNCVADEMETTLLPIENIRITKIDFSSALERLGG